MSLAIRYNGQTFQNFTAARVMLSLDVLCGAFVFMSTADENENFPIPAGALIECLADGKKIMTGYIDKINIFSENEPRSASHRIQITGRGKLQDLVDSTIKDEFEGDLNFIAIAQYALNLLGLTDIKIINKVGKIGNFTEDILSAESGIRAFDFLNNYAQKKQLLLNEDADGNLLIQRASSKVRGVKLRHTKLNRKQNNIKRINFFQDFSARYYKYIFSSQQNPASLDVATKISQIVNQSSGAIIDRSIRNTRQLELNPDENFTDDDLKNYAKWAANIRRARGFSYSCDVSGHTAEDNKPWAVNELINIYDEFCNINSELLVKQLVFNFTLDKGSTTTLSLAPRDAYQVFVPQEEEIDKTVYQEGDIFSVIP